MNELWGREIERVRYFSKRFQIRYDDNQKQKAQKDLEEKVQTQKDEKKDKEVIPTK